MQRMARQEQLRRQDETVDVLYTDMMGKEAGCEKSRQSIVTFNLVFAAVSSVESDDDIGRVQFLGRAEKHYALN